MNSLDKNNNVRTAIELLDVATDKLLVVLDKGKVIGTITDGDLRRYFLNGGLLSGSVIQVMNENPIVSYKDDLDRSVIENIPLGLDYLVVVDQNKKFLGLQPLDKKPLFYGSTTAVLMAGGQGTRLRPLTIDTPKPMVKINGIPILERQIKQLKAHGFSKFYISVNYLAEQITDYFQDGKSFGVSIQYLHEKKRLGTVGALSLIKDDIEDNFLLMNGDLITDIDFSELKKFHLARKSVMTIAAINHQVTVPFGVLKVKNHSLINIIEKPVYSNLCNAGIYMINKNVMNSIPNDIYTDITDTIESSLSAGDQISVFSVYESWSDVGTPEDLKKVQSMFND